MLAAADPQTRDRRLGPSPAGLESRHAEPVGMRRLFVLLVAGGMLGGLTAAAHAAPAAPTAPGSVSATVVTQAVNVTWTPPTVAARDTRGSFVAVSRDGAGLAWLPLSATRYTDTAVRPGSHHSYVLSTVTPHDGTAAAAPVSVTLPAYLVGSAWRDITPAGVVNLGGYGLGDGSVLPQAVVGRGGRAGPQGEHIGARAIVFDDGANAVAIANIETQGVFAAYEDGSYGLVDMAKAVAKDIPGLPADHIVIASDHTHSGPDTIGAWGGVTPSYLTFIKNQTVAAIEAAYQGRQFADVKAGHSDASDLIYNQACPEALNQSPTPSYTGPDVCPVPGKDGMVRVVQASAPSGAVVATLMAFAAHGTAGGGKGVNGDWPQFVSEAMAATYGGNGIAMEGAVGGTQPCRPQCSFTKPGNPGNHISDRKAAIVANYMAHVADAVRHATPVQGPVEAAQSFLREPITGPTVLGLFTAGQHIGARLLRSHENPWVVGTTLGTIASVVRVGDVLFAGTPGEGYPAIGAGVKDAVHGPDEVVQLGLAYDQAGYLISPARYVPVIAAEAPVNDNILFNASATIGDHVMCADIALAAKVGFAASPPPTCAPFTTTDGAGDPLAAVPVGGIPLP